MKKIIYRGEARYRIDEIYPPSQKQKTDPVGSFNPIFHNQEVGEKYFKKKRSDKKAGRPWS